MDALESELLSLNRHHERILKQLSFELGLNE